MITNTKQWDKTMITTVMILLLIPQIAHTFYIFRLNSHYTTPWFSLCYAIGVDSAILLFTRKGWLKTAQLYLFFTLAHNMVYIFLPNSIWSGVLIGVTLSTTIYTVTHLFLEDRNNKNNALKNEDVPKDLMELYEAHKSGVEIELKPFKCPECGKYFATKKQLNGHISAHKRMRNKNIKKNTTEKNSKTK